MPNTGYKAYTNLEQYYVDNDEATGIIKANSILDPDYIAPFIDLGFCPLPSPSPTSSPSITPTPTVTPTVTPSITTTPTRTPSLTPTPSITPSITTTPSKTPSVTVTPTPSLSPNSIPAVIDVNAQVVACVDGQCADTLAYSIYLNQPAPVAINYVLRITLRQFFSFYGGFNSEEVTSFRQEPTYYTTTLNVTGVIPVGAQGDQFNLNPCSTGGGLYVGCSDGVISVCIVYVDNTVINNVGIC
jgi:hypothetical protein